MSALQRSEEAYRSLDEAVRWIEAPGPSQTRCGKAPDGQQRRLAWFTLAECSKQQRSVTAASWTPDRGAKSLLR
jgi:hypothetical protein